MPNLFDRFISHAGAKALNDRFRPELWVLEDRSTPAQLWVAAPGSMTVINDVGPAGLSTGDTVRIALPGNQFTDATFGTTAFSTVESAVQAANSNADAANTVRVAPGTFTLNVPQVNVAKNLNLIGFGQGATTVRSGMNTATGGGSPTADTSATVLVNRGVALNVSSLTLDGGSGSGVDVPVLLKYTDTGLGAAATSTLSDVRIQNVGTAGGTPATAGAGVYVGQGNVTVSGSTLQNIGTQAVLFRGAGATGAVLGSTLTGQGAGARVNVGVGADNAGAVTARGNTFTGFAGATGGTDSAGVSVTGGSPFTPAVDVEHNQFTGNRVGVSLGSMLNLTGSAVVSDNNFVNSAVAGISSLTGGALTGMQNFYQGNGLNVSGLSAGSLLPSAVAVTSTPPTGSVASINGTITGRVINLTSGTGLGGVKVYIDTNQNGQLDPTEVAITTDANGNYTLSGLPVLNGSSPTPFRVSLVVPTGAVAGTTAVTVNLSPLQVSVGAGDMNVTVPPTPSPSPGDTIGTPTGPGRPTDGSVLHLSAAAAGFGNSPQVVVYNPDGSVRFSFLAFDAGYKGGVRVATGDLNHDGVQDVIVAAGAGANPHVKAFDGATGALLRSFFAFDTGFKGGVSVSAGDINRDGFDDIIVGAATGTSPHVKVFSGATGAELLSFLAFDPGFRGGVTVAGGDVSGDGGSAIVVGAGAGADPHVKVFNGAGKELLSFLAFDPSFKGGVTVAAGDADGDGQTEVIVGAGPGADPRVSVFEGATGKLKRSFLAFDPKFRGGVTVGFTTEADGSRNLIVGAGPGGANHVRHFNAVTGEPEESFFAWPSTGMDSINVG